MRCNLVRFAVAREYPGLDRKCAEDPGLEDSPWATRFRPRVPGFKSFSLPTWDLKNRPPERGRFKLRRFKNQKPAAGR